MAPAGAGAAPPGRRAELCVCPITPGARPDLPGARSVDPPGHARPPAVRVPDPDPLSRPRVPARLTSWEAQRSLSSQARYHAILTQCRSRRPKKPIQTVASRKPAVVAALAACVASTSGDHDGRHTTQAPAAAATPRARSATSAEVRQPRARADDATYQVSQRFVPSPLGIHTWLTCVLRRSWTSSTITAQWLSLSTG